MYCIYFRAHRHRVTLTSKYQNIGITLHRHIVADNFARDALCINEKKTHTPTCTWWMCECELKRDVNWFPVFRKLFGCSEHNDLVWLCVPPPFDRRRHQDIWSHACPCYTHETLKDNKKFRAKRRLQMTIFSTYGIHNLKLERETNFKCWSPRPHTRCGIWNLKNRKFDCLLIEIYLHLRKLLTI